MTAQTLRHPSALVLRRVLVSAPIVRKVPIFWEAQVMPLWWMQGGYGSVNPLVLRRRGTIIRPLVGVPLILEASE